MRVSGYFVHIITNDCCLLLKDGGGLCTAVLNPEDDSESVCSSLPESTFSDEGRQVDVAVLEIRC